MSRTRAAAVVWVASLIGVCAWAVVFAAAGSPVFYPYGTPMIGLGLIFSTLGSLIVRRRPDNRVGWLFLGLGASGAVALLVGQTSIVSAPSAASGALMLVSESFRLVAFLGLAFLIFIYPTGRLPSRRWRWVARALVIGIVLLVLETVVRPGPVLGMEWKQQLIVDIENPLAFASGTVASLVGAASQIAFIGFLGAVTSVVFRYRAARAIERQQIKLFAFASAACFVVLLGANILLPEQMDEGRLGDVLWNAPIVVLPAAAAAAILRHGLYDIDRIISRTISYLFITALLGGAFALIALLPLVVVGSGDAPDWLIAGATLAVAALFRPVRGRVQAALDRRFNRARYDAARTIEAFTSRLRDETQITALATELEELVRRTMQPSHVSLWTRRPS